MSRARTLLFPLATLALTASGCKKTDAAATPPEATAPAPTSQAATDAEPALPVHLVHLQASVEHLDDVASTVREITSRINPAQPFDPMAQIQAILLQLGFGPGFMNALDLSARHSLALAWASMPSGTPSTEPALRELSGAIAVTDARKLIDGTPPTFRPQPLGDGLWEVRQGETALVLKEGEKHLLVGLDRDDLQQAEQLIGAPAANRRINVRVWDLPSSGAVDLGIKRTDPIAAAFGNVFDEMSAFEVSADMAPEENFEVVLVANAPFEKLGLSVLGDARGAATALEQRLPGDPLAVATLSLGDLALARKMLDQAVANALGQNASLPPAFEDIKTKAVQGLQTLLSQAKSDAVVAMYLNAQGQPSIVLAANVGDAAATKEGFASLHQAMVKAAELQAVMFAQQKASQIKADYKPGGVKLGNVSGDRLDVTVPADFAAQLADWKVLWPKGKLETVAFADGDLAVWALGPDARGIATTIARNKSGPKTSLAQFQGLELLRTTLGGCHVCTTVDPVEYTRLRLRMLAEGDDRERAKRARAALAGLRKVEALGDGAIGVKVEPKRGELGLVAPRSLVFASPEAFAQLRDAWQLIAPNEAQTEFAAGPRQGEP